MAVRYSYDPRVGRDKPEALNSDGPQRVPIRIVQLCHDRLAGFIEAGFGIFRLSGLLSSA